MWNMSMYLKDAIIQDDQVSGEGGGVSSYIKRDVPLAGIGVLFTPEIKMDFSPKLYKYPHFIIQLYINSPPISNFNQSNFKL